MQRNSSRSNNRLRPLIVKAPGGLLTFVYISERAWKILDEEVVFSLKKLHRKISPDRSADQISRDVENMILCASLDRARRDYGLANDNRPGELEGGSAAPIAFRFDAMIEPPHLPRVHSIFRFMARPRLFAAVESRLKRKIARVRP